MGLGGKIENQAQSDDLRLNTDQQTVLNTYYLHMILANLLGGDIGNTAKSNDYHD